jgi:polar amino acid transport system substrate-binding protein
MHRDSMMRKIVGRKWQGFLLTCLMIFATIGFCNSQLFLAHPAQAESPKKVLQVATRLLPPFAIEEKGQYSGFSLELWQKIASKIGAESKIVAYPTLPAMLAAVEQKQADLAIAAISITADREQKMDFSHPIFNSGLQIMTRSGKKSGMSNNLVRDLFSTGFLQIIALAIGLVLIAAHIIWLLERRLPESPIAESYFPGIFEAAWWSASTLATQAEQMPKGAAGRVMAVFWMFIAVLFVSYFTATVTTSMTVQTLQGDIKSIEDLNNRVVATTAGSTAAQFLHQKNIKTLEVDKIETAYKELLGSKADAVVFDAPVLMYYAVNEGQGQVQLVNGLLREESYGIALAPKSPYRKPINEALLQLREEGFYQTLYDKWFKAKKDS